MNSFIIYANYGENHVALRQSGRPMKRRICIHSTGQNQNQFGERLKAAAIHHMQTHEKRKR